MGRRGFWDEEQRVTKLQDKKPVLKRLADSIPWESFRQIRDQGYAQERMSNAGRNGMSVLMESCCSGKLFSSVPLYHFSPVNLMA